MNDCYLTPIGIQSYCRNNRLWLNKIVIGYYKDMYSLKLCLYKSYKSREPKVILYRHFKNREDMGKCFASLWGLYPKIKIENPYSL